MPSLKPKKNLIAELIQAETFLSALDSDATEFTYQTFDDNADRNHPSLTRTYHGSFKKLKQTLELKNQCGAGIFVTINKTDLKGRRKSNVKAIRAVWQEDDGDGKPLPIKPHLIVESSPDKFHRYIFTYSENLDEFQSVQQRLITEYGSDPKAGLINQVLRLPGFYHQKVSNKKGLTGKPFLVRIVEG